MGDRVVCKLCDRTADGQRPFLCTQCACGAVYEARFKSVQVLLHREAYGRDIERTVRDGESLAGAKPSTILDAAATRRTSDTSHDATRGLGSSNDNDNNVDDGGSSDDKAAPARRLAYDRLRSERAQVKLRTRAAEQAIQDTEAECQTLRDEFERRREEMRERRELLMQRGKSSVGHLTSRLDAVNLSAAKLSSRTGPLQKKTTDSRAYMVREATNLWGLTVKRRRGRDSKIRETPYVVGLPICDLRELLSARPEQLNASLMGIAYMLNQTCSYLGLKMPSQLLLSDKSCAWPRILPVHSSYGDQTIASLGSSSSKPFHDQGSRSMISEGPEGSSGSETQARARPLHLKQPLMKLFAEDVLVYESFVEAMSLLAFDIAWLAKTQGIDVCHRRNVWSWEGACDVGTNLWLLFGPPPRRKSGQQQSSSSAAAASAGKGKAKEDEKVKEVDATAATTAAEADEPLARLGTFSHGTSGNNVSGPDAAMLGLREWRLANPNYLIRKVKEALADRKMAGEWELLEEDEWDTGQMPTTTTAQTAGVPGFSSSSSSPSASKAQSGRQQTKGWQKLRQR